MKCPGVGRSRTIHGTALSAEEVVGLNLKYSWTCNFKNMWGNRRPISDVRSEFQSKRSNPSPPSLVAFQSWAVEFPMPDTSDCFPKSQCISKENLSNFSSVFSYKNIFRLWILPKVVEVDLYISSCELFHLYIF